MNHRTCISPRVIVSAIKWLVLASIIAWVALSFPRKDWEILVQQPKNWWWLLLALSMVVCANILSFWRWQKLLLALEVPITFLETIRLWFLGEAFNTVSAGSVGGDLFKAIAAAGRSKNRRTEVITSVLVDRAIGMLGLILVAALSTTLAKDLSPQLLAIRNAAWILSIIGLSGISGLILFGKSLPLDLFNRIPWAGVKILRIALSLLVFKYRPQLAITMILQSLCVHSALTVAVWMVSSALYSDDAIRPKLLEHFLAVPPALLAGTLPITPGGIGLQEVGIDRLFKQIPTVSPMFSGLIVGTMYRAVLLAVALIGGITYLVSRPDPVDDDSNHS
ncbi:MAG: lysylphosphatidylglycerol synthase transmembrane domain-containing protein [Planctomycetota bacterium]